MYKFIGRLILKFIYIYISSVEVKLIDFLNELNILVFYLRFLI